jgi:hypothetical protein
MEFETLVNTRRSVRGYTTDPVPRALIEEIIQSRQGSAVFHEYSTLESLCCYRRAAR